MKVELGEKLKKIAEAKEMFSNGINKHIKDKNQLKDYIKRSQGDESIGFTKNDNTFLVETSSHLYPNNRLVCELILSQLLAEIDEDGEIYADGQNYIESYSFEVHYAEEKEQEAFGYAWQVVEAFVEALSE